MAINRASIARQLVPGLNAIFGTTYKQVIDEHKVLFDTETSERAFEEEVIFSDFGIAPVKFEGAAVQLDDAKEGWTSRYIHENIALGFAITEEAMADNLYDSTGKRLSAKLAEAVARTKQQKAANVFNNGFSTSYIGGDGQPLISASHPVAGGGTQSNTLGSIDLSEAALETAHIRVSTMNDDRNQLIGAALVSLHLPPQLQFVAERILKSQNRSGTADNDVNAIKNMGILAKGWFVNRRFTDANAWFLRTDVSNGAKLFQRTPVVTSSYLDFHTGNMLYKASERYSFGWSNWRQYFGSPGST